MYLTPLFSSGLIDAAKVDAANKARNYYIENADNPEAIYDPQFVRWLHFSGAPLNRRQQEIFNTTVHPNRPHIISDWGNYGHWGVPIGVDPNSPVYNKWNPVPHYWNWDDPLPFNPNDPNTFVTTPKTRGFPPKPYYYPVPINNDPNSSGK